VAFVPNPNASLAIGSPVTQAVTAYNGEDTYMTFVNGGPGNQNLNLVFSGPLLGTATSVLVNVYGTLGGPYLISQRSCSHATGCTIAMNNVVPDTYTVQVIPTSSATVGYTATLSLQ